LDMRTIKQDCHNPVSYMKLQKQIIYYFIFFCCAFLIFSEKLHAQNVDEKIELADSIYYSNPDRSCKLCDEALISAKAASDLDNTADAQMCLARYYLLKTNYTLFEANLKPAIKRFKKTNSKSRLASAFNLYGIYFNRIGNKQKSYDYHNESIRLFKEIDNIQGMSNIMVNLANAYIEDNRLAQAKEILDEIETYKDRLSQGTLYFYFQNYGLLMFANSNFNLAIDYFEKALKIAKEERMRDTELTASTLIAKTYIKLKRFADAEKLLANLEKTALAEDFDFEIQEIFEVQKELFTTQNKNVELEKVIEKIAVFEAQKSKELKERDLADYKHKSTLLKNKLKQQRDLLKQKEVRMREENKPNYLVPIGIASAIILLVVFLIYKGKRKY
jgi:tetratricopeptide (TPR) repeat protein